jgi:LmbE family N-acetylglucosaminyl deacetylase
MSKPVCSSDDVRELGCILSVWAHPYDETFSAAGIVAAAVANGQRVVCITATKGEAGIQDAKRWPPAELGEIRTKELKAALKVLGVKEHHWLGYRDGQCHMVNKDEAITAIRKFIKEIRPNTILTFGPDGLTGHSDHKTVSTWATAAAKGTEAKVYYCVQDKENYELYMREADEHLNIYFDTDEPPVYKREDCDVHACMDEAVAQKKCRALKAIPSQTESLLSVVPEDVLTKALSCECFVLAK